MRPSDVVLGKCGRCGGTVGLVKTEVFCWWGGHTEYRATCRSCGSRPAVFEMAERRKTNRAEKEV